MGVSLYNRVKITGLSTGWNTVTLSSFITLTSGHNTLWVEFDTNSTGTSYGIRKTGSGLTATFPSNSRINNTQPVEITGGQIDVNLGNTTNGEAFICWSDDYHTWLASPVSVIPGQTGAGTFTVDCTSALTGEPSPAASDCVGLFRVARAIKFGPTGATTTQQTHSLIGGTGYGAPQPCPLTGYAAEYTSGGGTTLSTDIMLIAYAPKDCFIYPSSYTAIINSGALATWVEQPTAYLDTIVNNFRWYNGGSSAISSCRGVGQVGYPLPNYTTPPYSAPDRNSSSLAHEWRPAGSNNKIEMFNNTDLLNRLIWMGGYVATLAAAEITSIDRLTPGLVSTITLNQAFAAITVAINDGSLSKTISLTDIGSNQFTFTVPSWVDSTPGLRYGDVTVTVTDGVDTTAGFADVLDPETGLATVNMEAVGAYNYVTVAGSTPDLKIGSQIRYTVAEGSVDKNGEYNNGTTGFSGVTRIWDCDPDSPFWTRYLDITVSSGSESQGGLTTIGISDQGLTSQGITSAGLIK